MHQSATLTVNMNETLATALITNLLKNAFIHNKSQGKIDIEIQSDHLTICNTGHPEALDASRIFHRFYQGKHTGEGSSGLGRLLPNRSANYISFTSDIIIQESIVSRSIFSISRNKIHFFPDFKIFSVLGSTFEL